MTVKEDLCKIHLRTAKLKNNQLKIFKNISELWNFTLKNVCFKTALFRCGNICDLLFPTLFLILFFFWTAAW